MSETSILRFLQEEETISNIIDEFLYDSSSYDFQSYENDDAYYSYSYNNNNITATRYDDHDERSGFGNYPLRQQIALAIIPKFTSFLSLIGSLCIISEVVMDQRKKAFSSVNRILLSMSVADIFFSTGWFLGVWPSPKSSTIDHQWGAAGNTQTCTFQGFIMQFGWTAGPLFNLTLSLYYLLIIRYNWRQDNLKSLDPWIHGTIWSLALGLAILPIPLNLYNNSWEVCWIESLPRQCGGPDGVDCIRGTGKAWIYALTLSSIFPSYLCMFLSVVFMGWIYLSVRNMETRNMAYAGGRTSTAIQTRARSTRVRSQAILFIGAFYFAFLPDAVSSFMYYTTGRRYFWLDIFAYGICMPSQGLFNCLVFLRQREVMKSCLGKVVQRIVCRGLCQHIPALVPKSLFVSPLELPSTIASFSGEIVNYTGDSLSLVANSIVGLGEEASAAFTGIIRRNSDSFEASSIFGLFKANSSVESDNGSLSSGGLNESGAVPRSGRLCEDDSYSDIEYSEHDDDIEALCAKLPTFVNRHSVISERSDKASSISSKSPPLVSEDGDHDVVYNSPPSEIQEADPQSDQEPSFKKPALPEMSKVKSSVYVPPHPPARSLTPTKTKPDHSEHMSVATDVESPLTPEPFSTPASFKRITFTGMVEVNPRSPVAEDDKPVRDNVVDTDDVIPLRRSPIKARRESLDNLTLDTLSDSETPID